MMIEIAILVLHHVNLGNFAGGSLARFERTIRSYCAGRRENCFHRPSTVGHLKTMSETRPDTQSWPDLAIGLYDKLTGRGAEITYEFHGLEISVPSSTSPNAQQATWKLSGIVKIRTKDDTTSPRS